MVISTLLTVNSPLAPPTDRHCHSSLTLLGKLQEISHFKRLKERREEKCTVCWVFIVSFDSETRGKVTLLATFMREVATPVCEWIALVSRIFLMNRTWSSNNMRVKSLKIIILFLNLEHCSLTKHIKSISKTNKINKTQIFSLTYYFKGLY